MTRDIKNSKGVSNGRQVP